MELFHIIFFIQYGSFLPCTWSNVIQIVWRVWFQLKIKASSLGSWVLGYTVSREEVTTCKYYRKGAILKVWVAKSSYKLNGVIFWISGIKESITDEFNVSRVLGVSGWPIIGTRIIWWRRVVNREAVSLLNVLRMSLPDDHVSIEHTSWIKADS